MPDLIKDTYVSTDERCRGCPALIASEINRKTGFLQNSVCPEAFRPALINGDVMEVGCRKGALSGQAILHLL